jgi:hypothetical protein
MGLVTSADESNLTGTRAEPSTEEPREQKAEGRSTPRPHSRPPTAGIPALSPHSFCSPLPREPAGRHPDPRDPGTRQRLSALLHAAAANWHVVH